MQPASLAAPGSHASAVPAKQAIFAAAHRLRSFQSLGACSVHFADELREQHSRHQQEGAPSLRRCLLQGLPYTVFQPLYIYGPYASKDYLGYFLGRLLRNRPVPIPSPGIQLVSLTHVEDVASMMAAVRADSWPALAAGPGHRARACHRLCLLRPSDALSCWLYDPPAGSPGFHTKAEVQGVRGAYCH